MKLTTTKKQVIERIHKGVHALQSKQPPMEAPSNDRQPDFAKDRQQYLWKIKETVGELTRCSNELLLALCKYGHPLDRLNPDSFRITSRGCYPKAINFGFSQPFSDVVAYVAALSDTLVEQLYYDQQTTSRKAAAPLASYPAVEGPIRALSIYSHCLLDLFRKYGPPDENLSAEDYTICSEYEYDDEKRFCADMPFAALVVRLAAFVDVLYSVLNEE